MNGNLMLGVAGLAGGILGALLGGLFVWRRLGARLVGEVAFQLQAATAAAARAERAEQGMRDAMASASTAQESHEAAQQATLRALQDVLRRIPQASQQASKVETVALAAASIASAVTSMPVPQISTSALPPVSARPPEWLLTPLPRPEPVYDESEPVLELSDEEIDALPPDVPVPDKARKRILPTPKGPILRNL